MSEKIANVSVQHLEGPVGRYLLYFFGKKKETVFLNVWRMHLWGYLTCLYAILMLHNVRQSYDWDITDKYYNDDKATFAYNCLFICSPVIYFRLEHNCRESPSFRLRSVNSWHLKYINQHLLFNFAKIEPVIILGHVNWIWISTCSPWPTWPVWKCPNWSKSRV